MINIKLHIILFRLASSLSSSIILNDLKLIRISRDFADCGCNNG